MDPQQSFREISGLRLRLQMNNRLRLESLAALSKVFREYGEPISDQLLASVVLALPDELHRNGGVTAKDYGGPGVPGPGAPGVPGPGAPGVPGPGGPGPGAPGVPGPGAPGVPGPGAPGVPGPGAPGVPGPGVPGP